MSSARRLRSATTGRFRSETPPARSRESVPSPSRGLQGVLELEIAKQGRAAKDRLWQGREGGAGEEQLGERPAAIVRADAPARRGRRHWRLYQFEHQARRPVRDQILGLWRYVFAIRSRMLCREVQGSLAYRWFCGPVDRGQDPRSFGVLARAQRAVPRERHLPNCIRACRGRMSERRRGRWGRLCGGCQPDRCRCQQAAIDPRIGVEQRA
jgi:hypothetical protein